MSVVARQPRGIRTGGRFAPNVRTEPSLTLSPGMASSAIYRHYTENDMGKAEQRNLSRRLIQGVHDSGLLKKMAGNRNLADVESVLAAARDNDKLDAAIHAVLDNERRNPGVTHPDSIGFQLCRHLLQAEHAR
jgi:hypothetical protein